MNSDPSSPQNLPASVICLHRDCEIRTFSKSVELDDSYGFESLLALESHKVLPRSHMSP